MSIGLRTDILCVAFIANKTATFTVDPTTDKAAIYPVDTTGGAVVCNLPAAESVVVGTGTSPIFWIQKVAGANSLTIDPSGAETIDGSATVTVTSCRAIYSTGTAWRTLMSF